MAAGLAAWSATRFTWISFPLNGAGPVSRTGYVVIRRTSAVPAQIGQLSGVLDTVARGIGGLERILPE
jgi:hypothetical protein